jgi:glycosyltransferase involved in cell wall biosynthesis
MRILYHHRTQGEEPESVHIAAIVTALQRLGHDVDVLGPAPIVAARGAPKRSWLGRVKESIPRALVELAQVAYNIVSFAKLARQLRRREYDFIYERYALYNVAGVLAARAFGLPLILEVNTLYARAWKHYYGLLFGRMARAMERWTARGAEAAITVTEVQRAQLQEMGVAPARIRVSHNAIDPAEFDPSRHRSSQLRRELGLEPIVAGFVGTMHRWQGVKGFADVIQAVRAERSDVSFLFVGDGEGRASLESELDRRSLRSAAAFVGRQSHAAVPQYIAAMDVGLLLDSNSYGSPMKVFEYWAMSKAVIAPAVPPVLEVLRDGETGLLISPGDAAAMARQLLTLAADAPLRSRLGQAGRRYVLEHHTWEQNALAILDAVASTGTMQPARPAAGTR